MKKFYTEEQRNEILQRYRSGEKVASICEDTGIAKSTIYEWAKSNNKKSGYIVADKTVAAIMHENGWFSVRGGAKAIYEMNKFSANSLLLQHQTKYGLVM